jgi:hypothetical protein
MAELETSCCGPEGCQPCGCAPSEAFDGGSNVFGAALYAIADHEQIPDTGAEMAVVPAAQAE